jgi:hypothetical protein
MTSPEGNFWPFLVRALAIREKAFGPDPPAVLIRLENLAGLYRAAKRNNEAEPMEQRAVRIRATPR